MGSNLGIGAGKLWTGEKVTAEDVQRDLDITAARLAGYVFTARGLVTFGTTCDPSIGQEPEAMPMHKCETVVDRCSFGMRTFCGKP